MKGVAGVMAGGLTGALKPLMHKVAGAGLLVVVLVMAVGLLSGCATTSNTCGPGEVELTHVSDRPYRWTGDFSALECRANRGDKKAQAVMGDVYQYGDMGEPIDLRRAKAWYGKAASLTPGQAYVYTPPVGQEKTGRMIAVPKAVKSGNAYAQRQFALLSQLPVGRKLSDAFVKYFRRVCFADGLPFSKNAEECAEIILSEKIIPLKQEVLNPRFPPDYDRCAEYLSVLKNKKNYETIEVPFVSFPTREDFARYVGEPADRFPIWPLHMALYSLGDGDNLGLFLGKGAITPKEVDKLELGRPYSGFMALLRPNWPDLFKRYFFYGNSRLCYPKENPSDCTSRYLGHSMRVIIQSIWDGQHVNMPGYSWPGFGSMPYVLIRFKPTKETLSLIGGGGGKEKFKADKSLMPLILLNITLNYNEHGGELDSWGFSTYSVRKDQYDWNLPECSFGSVPHFTKNGPAFLKNEPKYPILELKGAKYGE